MVVPQKVVSMFSISGGFSLLKKRSQESLDLQLLVASSESSKQKSSPKFENGGRFESDFHPMRFLSP